MNASEARIKPKKPKGWDCAKFGYMLCIVYKRIQPSEPFLGGEKPFFGGRGKKRI